MGNGVQSNSVAALIAIGCALLLAAINQDVVAQVWRYSFDDGTYSHAFLIPFISLFLLYQAYRHDELRFRGAPSRLALLLQILAGGLYLFVITAQLSLGYLGLLPILLLLCYLALFRTNRYLLASALLYLFAMPVWGLLTIPLQQLSILAVGEIMALTGIPTYIEGESFTIPNGVFAIEHGCSGLRYLLVSLLISFLYITLYLKQRRAMLLFLTVAVVGALVANWIRITLLILIGYFTDMQSSIIPDHNNFGWYIYIPFLLLLFSWGRHLESKQQPPARQTSEAEAKLILSHTLPLLLLLLSSSQIVKTFTPSVGQQLSHSDYRGTVTPQVKGEDQLSISRGVGDLVIHHYYYSGQRIEYKAAHFENHPLPEGWKELRQTAIDGVPVWLARSPAGDLALFSRYFMSGELQANSKGQQKRNRLKNALAGIRESEFVWFYQPCAAMRCMAAQPEFATQVRMHPLNLARAWTPSP